jgi:hypothetical protein
MKKPVLQSMALASLAVGSMGGAQAALTSPTFGCLVDGEPGAGGQISWGDYSTTAAAPTLSFDFLENTFDSSSKLDCSGGVLSETVVARKAGEGQKEFLVVKLQEVLVAGFEPASDSHLKLGFTQLLGAVVNGVQTYEAYWDITGDYKFAIDNTLFTSTSFLGLKLQTTQKFDGLSALKYDYLTRELSFTAQLQEFAGLLSLTSTPRADNAVSEPGTLALLGTGLLGAAGLRRRRRSW